LVSRSRVFQLKPLEDEHLRQIARQALRDPERGYGGRAIELCPDALDHLVGVANGDARAVLNALELAVETTPPDEAGRIVIDLGVAEESIQRRAVLYDKEGDYHFDTISAFIKSLRGSDPDAALYWLARMVYAGEDPRFLFRRMLIFCGEDVGLADPHAMMVCTAAAEAFDRVGMPEGNYHLGLAALYLATAPKSNSVMGFFDALAAVEKEREGEVPNHLRDASRDKEGFGHGVGYQYPHAYRDHWVAQQYLPDSLRGKVFYRPGHLGHELGVAESVRRHREAQLAAALDEQAPGAPPEILSFSPQDRGLDRWLARTLNGVGSHLAQLREALFAAAGCQRHWRVLDLAADTGLLTWEALRQAPEGGVWALVSTSPAASALQAQAAAVPDLRRPEVLVGAPVDLPRLVAGSADPATRFELVVGRQVLTPVVDRPGVLRSCAEVMAPGGVMVLVENLPRHTQRLYDLVPSAALDAALAERLREAEEALYADPDDPWVHWDLTTAAAWFEAAGLRLARSEEFPLEFPVTLTAGLIERWFTPAASGQRPAYCQHLRRRLDDEEVGRVAAAFRMLAGNAVMWHSRAAVMVVRAADAAGASSRRMAAGRP
ncbi:MAG: AAA family ATPase, partial [Lentisphaerae bacterium]|nr:AAA family ATPase [Lentisphaerota bacterium]